MTEAALAEENARLRARLAETEAALTDAQEAQGAWRAALAMGVVEGMRNDLLGPVFIERMFEPFVIALTERLDTHVARGQMRPADTRMAALALASPLLLGALHQDQLGGARDYPLDRDAFLEHVVEGFLRAYRAD
ncbi:hypothetical protein GI374_14675 [Paracoccus sp. S-4012]|uniref:TetR/AcrR family transcriptional regulator C-terminal domain-containing protein n=1 Tax=Paracoccus sp. S-4012 TaxID=2665648 RepID=UPI0012AF8127|nr:TetR/AcrR family transcriptional regulator C-terminal domain-containing protein [Paracoccus sp. S-4012]MRX51657.1 hypothetical protein [Paracoccus sp. S-4012]